MRTPLSLLVWVCPFTALFGSPWNERPGAEITIMISDYAGAAEVLGGAEQEAARILGRAGVSANWVLCPTAQVSATPVCSRASLPAGIFVHVLPRSSSRAGTDANAFGFARPAKDGGFGFFAAAYFDRVRRLSHGRRQAAILLGAVIAHEIGHLLLGPGAHSLAGIMSPHWGKGELRQIQQGRLIFVGSQVGQIRSEALYRKATLRGMDPFAERIRRDIGPALRSSLVGLP